MRLSKASYFADFAVYPPVVLALLILALQQVPPLVWIEWSIACLTGIAAWTLLEYVIHRGVLHRFDFASGITAGLMLGYVWYGGVHHVLHHWRVRPGSYLYRLKRRHALHHYARHSCNFGVTTQFWDRVFGTAHPGR